MIKLRIVRRFDGVGIESSMRMIKKYLIENESFAVELSESERVIKLNIPFTEMYRKCTREEWEEVKQLIKKVTSGRDKK